MIPSTHPKRPNTNFQNWQGSQLPSLLQSRLHAPRVLCVDKVVDYVCKRLKALNIESEGAPLFYTRASADAGAARRAAQPPPGDAAEEAPLLILACNGAAVPWDLASPRCGSGSGSGPRTWC